MNELAHGDDPLERRLGRPVAEALGFFYPETRPRKEILVAPIGAFIFSFYKISTDENEEDDTELGLTVLACLLYVYCEDIMEAVRGRLAAGEARLRLTEIRSMLARGSLDAAIYIARYVGVDESSEEFAKIRSNIVRLQEHPVYQVLRRRSEEASDVNKLIRYSVTKEKVSSWDDRSAAAYSKLSTKDAVLVRGVDRFVTAVLGTLSLIVWALQLAPSLWLMSTAHAEATVAAPTPSPTKPFTPPLGISPAIWSTMVLAAFALLMTFAALAIWQGYFARKKNERAARFAERFGTLLLGAFFGHSVA
ncbi:hypothetical protein [Paraburkholderia strydomiana]|uniref:Type II secretion system protein GspF domain-containing protein n=1 Tax=Paraburkholderia strydomiana TaxID=1245417 RepID=A0ABW9BY07_9BURK